MMPIGPGKYGANAEALLRQFGGRLCVVILDGGDGVAFDVATSDPTILRALPDILRETADNIQHTIEADVRRSIQ